MENSLRRLDVITRQLFADRGLWTLYTGLLVLQWIDPDDSATVVSPIVLIPVELTRPARDQPYSVRRIDEDPVLNPTLRLKLSELGVELPEFDADDLDLAALREGITGAVATRPGWVVLDRAVLTTFSFQKEAMYRDLTANAETILANPHVQVLGLGPDAPVSDQLAFDPPTRAPWTSGTRPRNWPAFWTPTAANAPASSRPGDGRSFVMDGPPGTGKSQTIANIIAELMAAGKTVLFVSEKAAALDVGARPVVAGPTRLVPVRAALPRGDPQDVVDDLYTTLQQQVAAEADCHRQRPAPVDRHREQLTRLRGRR